MSAALVLGFLMAYIIGGVMIFQGQPWGEIILAMYLMAIAIMAWYLIFTLMPNKSMAEIRH